MKPVILCSTTIRLARLRSKNTVRICYLAIEPWPGGGCRGRKMAMIVLSFAFTAMPLDARRQDRCLALRGSTQRTPSVLCKASKEAGQWYANCPPACSCSLPTNSPASSILQAPQERRRALNTDLPRLQRCRREMSPDAIRDDQIGVSANSGYKHVAIVGIVRHGSDQRLKTFDESFGEVPAQFRFPPLLPFRAACSIPLRGSASPRPGIHVWTTSAGSAWGPPPSSVGYRQAASG